MGDRKAIALEETADLVAACFSSREEKTKRQENSMGLRRTDCTVPMRKWLRQRARGQMGLILYPL